MGRAHAQPEHHPGLLFSGSALIIAGLFGFGAHLGDQHRERVLAFEQTYFGWLRAEPPIASAPPPPQLPPSVPDAMPALEARMPTVPSMPPQRPTSAPPQLASPPLAVDPGDQVPAPTAPDAPPALPQLPVEAPAPPTVPSPALASGNAMAVPVTLRVKILVDDRLVDASDDWLLMAVRTVSSASKVFRDLFGIELALAGAVRWSGARAELGGSVLLQELRAHPREDADLLLGFVHTPLRAADYELGAPDEASALSGAYGLVGPSANAELPYLQGTLRTLGHLLGARSVIDGTEDYRLGSFMSDAPPPTGRPPWIDLANRERILARKGRPFQSEPAR